MRSAKISSAACIMADAILLSEQDAFREELAADSDGNKVIDPQNLDRDAANWREPVSMGAAEAK